MKKKTQDDFSKINKIKLQKAKIILSKEDSVQKVNPGLYLIQSQTGIGWYKIQWNGKEFVCNCPDYIKHGHIRPCKHVLALKLHLELGYVSIEGEEPKMEPVTYSQEWSSYNAAQVQEFEIFDQLLYQLVLTIDEPERQGAGRPGMKLQDQIFCCIMKVYSQLSSRRAKYLYHDALQRQQIEHAPHFNKVSKTLNKKRITKILHGLVHLSAQPLTDIETHFAVDSSGFRCSSFGHYCFNKHKVKLSHNWLKVHICTGVNTNIVTDVVITDEHAGDSPQFKKLIRNTAKQFNVGEVSADAAYSARKNYEIVGQYGGKAFIAFKKNAKGTARGSYIWRRAYNFFQLHMEEFMNHYHQRSNAESTFAAIKKKFGETIKSRNRVAQVNEMLCKIICYNLTVIIRAMIEMGVVPDFFSTVGLKKEVTLKPSNGFGK